MSFPTMPYGETVTLVSRTVSGQDAYGNDTYTETQTDITPCSVQPTGSTENIVFTDQVSTDLTIFMPFGTVVNAVDAVIWNGDKYEVQGEINQWTSPFSGHSGPVQLRVSRVTGASV